MKGDYAHAGFPEIAYSRYADALVSKGYKVGRVEQTETPEAMTERTRGQKLDKTVRREICKITTPGTKTFNVLDGQVSNAFSHYLFSFVEKVRLSFHVIIFYLNMTRLLPCFQVNTVGDKKVRLFGVCFVDTSVGKIHVIIIS
jgi:DNA mismatch repair protein MSH6